MGRIDDAMRRAAGGADAPADVALAVPDEAEILGDEPFPLELRRPGAQDAAPVAVAEAATLAPSSSAVPAPRPQKLIDTVDRRLTGKLVPDQAMPAPCREQYRRLAATLHHAQVDRGIKVVMIASAVAGEGKTLTATNLALTFSESYHRSVLLIDADLRRPSIHGVFQIEAEPGLSDGLIALDHQKFVLHQVSERLTILPAGRPSSDPMAGLTSGRMRRLIAEGRESFDWIIIDTPPVGLMTDANLLAAMADGALLVVKAGSTSYRLAQRAVEAIGRERLLGAVLNRAQGNASGSYYHYHYYYGAHRDQLSLRERILSRFRRPNA